MMYGVTLVAVYCLQLVAGNTFTRVTSALQNCPLVGSLTGAVEQNSLCSFTVLSLSSYIYRPSTEMNFMLLSTNWRQEASYYNVEVTDARGRAVGQFTKGDNICNAGTMLTHNPKSAVPSRKVSFSWQTPSSDLGNLFFRFSVGSESDDGEIKIWLNCHRQAPLKYFEEIASNVLYAIENPLEEQNSYRGVGLPASPPHTHGIIQESPTAPSVKEQSTEKETIPIPSPVRPNYRSTSRTSSTGLHVDTDGYSWCMPYGGPRFQIVAGTGCANYTTYPNSDLFSCYPGLIFSVSHCVCNYVYPDTPCTWP